MPKLIRKNGKVEKLAEMKLRIARMEKENREYRRLKHDLAERVKELRCLYGISKLFEKPYAGIGEVFAQVVMLLPPAWQYPDITKARIVFKDREYKTRGFGTSPWRQSADIKVGGRIEGCVEVYYLTKRPDAFEGPFLKEERNLLNVIAEQLENFAERKRIEVVLEEKNAALKEIIGHIEAERQETTKAVQANIEKVLFPVLKKLKRKGSRIDAQYVDLIETNLSQLTGSFGRKIADHHYRLSPREIEICNFIKNGLGIKEIADFLNISFYSVATHRRNIRKKLELANKKINLSSFLCSSLSD